ncbi:MULTISPECIES: hypothetical protein [unclassified Microbacterium]|nr:hypothetical protein [Microbacterium sp. JB110]RCS57988.1 hypothetical protein CIK77_15360 [Microbacterium sp. JB110]SJM55652.1 hypothetical protein CZ774_07460 [Frigoribacterium sp. JB110]
MSYIQGYDSESLREIVDEAECRQRLEDIGQQRSLPALLERVWLLKVLGELDEAIALSEQSVRVARMAGTRKDLLRSRILHSSVLIERGAYDAADSELSTCAEEAEGQEWPSITAFALSHRGRARYDAGDPDGARSDFKRVLFLRQELGAADSQLEVAMSMVEAAERRRGAAVAAS